MSNAVTTDAPRAPGSPSRGWSLKKRIGISAAIVAIIGVVIGGLIVFSAMVNETHFDRPSAEFDAFAAQVESLPGVDRVDTERWVEAPTFADPTSWIFVTTDQAGLPGVLAAACSTDYPDAITWSIDVRTPSAAEVALHAAPAGWSGAGADARCPSFGFDAVALVAELDRVAPGLEVQPSVWDDGTLAFVAPEEQMPSGFDHLLPLVEHSDALVAASGMGEGALVEINSSNLGFLLPPGESAAYLGLLTELAEQHAVTSYWADGGGTPIDGVEKVQIVAPGSEHAAIERAIRSSSVHVADLPVRFIEQ